MILLPQHFQKPFRKSRDPIYVYGKDRVHLLFDKFEYFPENIFFGFLHNKILKNGLTYNKKVGRSFKKELR